MKTNFRLLTAAGAALALLFSGCSKDDATNGGGENGKGKAGYAQLTIVDGTGDATKTPDGDEGFAGTSLAIFIFDANGNYEYGNATMPVTNNSGDFVTSVFEITSGDKYVYVFANSLPNGFVAPNNGTLRAGFEKQVLALTISDNTSISQTTDFMLATLWGQKITVLGATSPTTPENLNVEIGRVASKVELNSVAYNIKGNALGGTFSDAKYTLGSVPNKIYAVGQFSGAGVPPAQGIVYTSAVHNEPETVGGVQNPVFRNYATWKTQGQHFYAVENTTAPDGTGLIYYGNTTYVNFEIKYTPAPAELHDANGVQNSSLTLTNGTFWTAWVNGQRLIFAQTPSASIPGLSTDPLFPILEYTNGLNYYHVPIMDKSENANGVASQCVVIRNHYYELALNSISNLGNNTNTVDPEEPILDEYEIQLTVKILPWHKIKQGIDL